MNYPDSITLENTKFQNMYDSFVQANKIYMRELSFLKGLSSTSNNHFKAKEFVMVYESQYDPLYLVNFYKEVEDYINNLPSDQKYMYCINDKVPDETLHLSPRVNVYIKCTKDVDITQFDEYKEQEVKVDKLLKEVVALKGECDSMLIDES